MQSLKYDRQARVHRADGTGDSGWLLMPAVDVPASLHILEGTGHFETTGDSLQSISADTAVPNPDDDGDLAAPVSKRLYPLPTALRFVGAGRWSVIINERQGWS